MHREWSMTLAQREAPPAVDPFAREAPAGSAGEGAEGFTFRRTIYPPATRSRNGLPGLKNAYFLAAMAIFSPVAGLVPVRAARILTPKVPNPGDAHLAAPVELPGDDAGSRAGVEEAVDDIRRLRLG